MNYEELLLMIEGLPHPIKVPLRHALKHANKVEELLELYKELSFIRKFEYKKQEPSETEKLCMKQIKVLEEEMK